MLTAKQIEKLPKGNYPNHLLVKMFPKQQGIGKMMKRAISMNPKKDK